MRKEEMGYMRGEGCGKEGKGKGDEWKEDGGYGKRRTTCVLDFY